MTDAHHFLVLSLRWYYRLSKRPLLFRSFTGLTVVELDSIYDKEITKRYYKNEMQRLSKRKTMERSLGAARIS